METHLSAPRNPQIPGPLWFELAERNAPFVEFVSAYAEAAFDRQPLAAARGLLGGAVMFETTAWRGADFPPRGAGQIGRGQLLFLNGGLEFRPFTGENQAKEIVKAGLGLADLTGLSEAVGPLAELGDALLDEIGSSPGKVKPVLRIPFVEIVAVAQRRGDDRLEVISVVHEGHVKAQAPELARSEIARPAVPGAGQSGKLWFGKPEDPQNVRTTYHFAGLGREWPAAIMAARLEWELDWLRIKLKEGILDVAAIERPIIERASARDGEADWPHRKAEALAEAVAAGDEQLAARGVTPAAEAAALLRELAPLLPAYQQVPAFADQLDALAAAAAGQETAAADDRRESRIPQKREAIRVGRDESPRLFRGISRAMPEGIVRSIAVTADGRVALRGDSDGWLRLWEIDSGRELRRWSADERGMKPIWRVAVSPDGRTALSAGEDATVRLWCLEDGREIRRFAGHAGAVRGVAFSADGRRAISGGLDGNIFVWDVESGRHIRHLRGLPPLRSVAFTPDGRLALTADEWGQIGVVEVSGWRGVFYCKERHAGAACDVAASPDGRLALSGGADGTVRLWDIGRRRELRRFEGHTQGVLGIAFTPDGRAVLSAGDDNTVGVWDVASGRELQRFAGPEAAPSALYRGFVACIACLPDGRRALAGGSGRQRVVLWELPAL